MWLSSYICQKCLTAMFNILLVVSHIQSAKNNAADLLSKWRYTSIAKVLDLGRLGPAWYMCAGYTTT